MSERMTYLLVDGENIDATLGTSILGRRPSPEDRPRWERLLDWTQRCWNQPVQGLFFLAAKTGDLPMSFVQALMAQGYRPVPLSGGPNEKVVDMAIQRTMEALAERDADVMLVSHDGDFLPQLEDLADGERRVGVLAFTEFRNQGISALAARGVQLYDLEYDVRAFNTRLPRIRVIPIDEFDPLEFL